MPSLTATCYIMTTWYIWEACPFLESKEKEWIEEGGYARDWEEKRKERENVIRLKNN